MAAYYADQEIDEPDIAKSAETSKGLVYTKPYPYSPLHSAKRFEDLHLKPELLKGIYAMGLKNPSRIQEFAIPYLLADPPQNMIAQSQSGTGKTIAFALAMLSRVNTALNYPQVICMTPTYELAKQTAEIVARIAKFSIDINIRLIITDENLSHIKVINDHILIGTPGKMSKWAVTHKLFELNKISIFVLDEADKMIKGNEHHSQFLSIHKKLSKKCRSILFSTSYDEEALDFARLIVPDPIIIRLMREQVSLANIKQYYINCKNVDGKYTAIQNIYGRIGIGQAIIFCHTRNTAGYLAAKLAADRYPVAFLFGDLTVQQRFWVLDRFRSGLQKILITTNVLSRGIDIEQVTIVVNFDLPMDFAGNVDFETYLNRIGRTGRFGKKGVAINLIDNEKSMADCVAIQKHFKKEIKYLNVDNIEKIGY